MQVRRLFEFMDYQLAQFPLEKSFGSFVDNQWKFFSSEEMVTKSDALALGLREMGLQAGDKVAIVSYKNRPEWTIADLAIQKAGMISVPLYPTISAKEYAYILGEAEVKACFMGDGDLYNKVDVARKSFEGLEHMISFDRDGSGTFWKDLFPKNIDDNLLSQMKDAIKPDDLVTIIYTSGTTGNPKGVMLTHRNIVSVIYGTVIIILSQPGEKVLSFLPLCHIFERAVSYGYMYKCVSCYYTGTDNLGGPEGDLQQVQPSFFSTVPRLLEKVFEKIYNKGLALTGIKKKLFFWALSLADDYEVGQTHGPLRALKGKIADRLIFSKWREALGGNVKGIVTGAAACPAKIAKVFTTAGIPICEAYGLTETAPTLTMNRLDGHTKIGTVGIPMEGIDLIIDNSDEAYGEGEGEILANGPNVMLGYYKKPEETAAVFKEIEGKKYFKTGDIGKFVKGPGNQLYLKITDRKKELLKTSGGKYVAPAPIENLFKESFVIDNMMVIGEKQKFVSALIVPAEEALKKWCECNEIEWESVEKQIEDPKVIAHFQQIIDEINPNFSHVEQVKKFRLLANPWEPTKIDNSDAELTPTMKLKRRVIAEKCAKEIQELYAQK